MRALKFALIVAAGCGSGGSGGTYEVGVLSTGGGRVASNIPGLVLSIDCGSVCQASYEAHEVVTLEATPEPGETFLGWSGACSGTEPCTFEVSADVLVWAAFGPPSTTWSVATTNYSDGLAAGSYGGDFLLAGVRGPESGAGTQHGTLVAYTASGAEDWRIDSSDLGRFNDLATDEASATLYAVGDYSGSLTISGHELSSEGGDAGFLLETTGSSVTDLVGLGGIGPSHLRHVYSSVGGVTVSGQYAGEVLLGSDTHNAVGGTDVLVAHRLDGNWSSFSIGSSADDDILGMAEDELGRCWLLLDLGESALVGTEQAGPGLVLVVADGDSIVQSMTIGGEPHDGSSFEPGAMLAIDAESMVVAATYRGTIALGTQQFVSSGASDFFIARLQLDLSPLWSDSFGGAGVDYAQALATVGDTIVVGGAFSGPTNFGGALPVDSHTVVALPDDVDDGFIAAYSLDGDNHWVRRIGGWSTDPGVFDLAASGNSVFAAATVNVGPFATGADPLASGEGTSAVGILVGL